MRRGLLACFALSLALTLSGREVRGQWAYPYGYGRYGWGGWGGSTVGGDMARGLGVYAAGAGVYNQRTAIANSINTDTVLRWNQYWYEAQQTAARSERERLARRQANVNLTQDQLLKRLRENPEQRDINQGDALNVALDEINDPRVYSKALAEAKVKIGGENIRDIPFQYAAAAVSTSMHQLTQGQPPAALLTPAFEAERTELKEMGAKIRKQIEEGEKPDSVTIEKAVALIKQAQDKLDKNFKKGQRDYNEANKYLKGLSGLLRMLDTPAIEVLMAGVEKRPDATLGELLGFMNAFNLRFGPATTPRQRAVYQDLYPKLDVLRDQAVASLGTTATASAKSNVNDVGEFFSGMEREDLERKAPKPPAPGSSK